MYKKHYIHRQGSNANLINTLVLNLLFSVNFAYNYLGKLKYEIPKLIKIV